MEEKTPEAKRRRPYQRPEVQSSELFERRSLTCGYFADPSSARACKPYQHQSV